MKSSEKQMAGAAARSLWLSDLARAIDEAQRLAWRLGAVEGRSDEALELYVRLESVRAEVSALQRGSLAAHRAPDLREEAFEPFRNSLTRAPRDPE